jgi:hypothetical protein
MRQPVTDPVLGDAMKEGAAGQWYQIVNLTKQLNHDSLRFTATNGNP